MESEHNMITRKELEENKNKNKKEITWRLEVQECRRLALQKDHVSLLEPYVPTLIPHRDIPPPPPIELSEGPEYQVEAILDSKIMRNRLFYLVDWLGYTPNDRTWEPTENVTNTPELVQESHHHYPEKPSPSSCIATRGTRRQRRG